MISICKQFEFHAAHHLPDYEGACQRLHGHSYLLEVEVTGPIIEEGSSRGMICDFKMIKSVVEDRIMSKFDHQDLNDSLNIVPTAEMLIFKIVDLLRERLPKDVVLHEVKLWESRSSFARWRRNV